MFSTKGNTLKNLENKIQIFQIPVSLIFNVFDWKKNQEIIIGKIKKTFKNKIIFRSSTTFEDAEIMSGAGVFESISNINVYNTKKIKISCKNYTTHFNS